MTSPTASSEEYLPSKPVTLVADRPALSEAIKEVQIDRVQLVKAPIDFSKSKIYVRRCDGKIHAPTTLPPSVPLPLLPDDHSLVIPSTSSSSIDAEIYDEQVTSLILDCTDQELGRSDCLTSALSKFTDCDTGFQFSDEAEVLPTLIEDSLHDDSDDGNSEESTAVTDDSQLTLLDNGSSSEEVEAADLVVVNYMEEEKDRPALRDLEVDALCDRIERLEMAIEQMVLGSQDGAKFRKSLSLAKRISGHLSRTTTSSSQLIDDPSSTRFNYRDNWADSTNIFEHYKVNNNNNNNDQYYRQSLPFVFATASSRRISPFQSFRSFPEHTEQAQMRQDSLIYNHW